MNKEDYRLARAHNIACIAAFEFSGTIEKLRHKDYDAILDLMVACYDAGYIYAKKQLPDTITFEFPNMNNKNNEEV